MNPNYYEAPVAIKQSRFNRKFILIIAGLVVALIIGIIFMILGNQAGPSDLYARAAAREQALLTLIDTAAPDIGDADLRKLSADAKLFATSDVANLTKNLGELGVSGIPGDVAEEELADSGVSKLEQAKLQNKFDEVYQGLLSQKIESQSALLREIFGQLSPGEPKVAINRTYVNLQSIKEDLELLNS